MGVKTCQHGEYRVTQHLLDQRLLEQEWKALEQTAEANFFLSWAWVSNWLSVYRPNVSVLKVYCAELLVGLVIATEAKSRRHHVMTFNSIQFQETGDPEKDQIWIEYNGVLSAREHERAVITAVLSALDIFFPAMDELVVGAVNEKFYAQLKENTLQPVYEIWRSSGYGVNLRQLKNNGQPYLASLSKNTRHQISRSIRLYEEQGSLVLVKAQTAEEANSVFRAMAPLHIQRWGRGKGQSGFANQWFVNFHEQLIVDGFSKGIVDLLKIEVAGNAIAYLYCFKWLGTVYFYLMSTVQERDNKLKPGLVAHALAIEHYMGEGCYEKYDFMGGNERYKQSLADETEQFYRIRMSKRNWKFLIESSLREWKHQLLKGKADA